MAQSQFLPTLPSLLASPGKALIHRDLSWLQFNERVLKEARTSSNPLLERVKFLAISASNLDEFFMIRYASLGRSIAAAARTRKTGKRRLVKIRDVILETVTEFTAKQQETLDILSLELYQRKVRVVRGAKEGETGFTLGRKVFENEVLGRIQAPQPFSMAAVRQLQTLQTGIAFGDERWFTIPRDLPLVYVEPDGGDGWSYVFLLDDLLTTHLGPAFDQSGPPGFLRLTRDGDFSLALEEDPESIPDIVRSGVNTREIGRPVRLEYRGDVSGELLGKLSSSLRVAPGQMFLAQNTLFLRGLWTVVSRLPDEKRKAEGASLPDIRPYTPVPLRGKADPFEAIRMRDIMLHHPYGSFDGFVNFIKKSAADPAVTSIQQTVYRMDAYSEVIEALKRAAAAGKRVRVVIELRARFDELNNLRLAEELRQAGIEVAFGFGKLKIHAKIALVTRQEEGGERYYTHVSTGNYNASTARLYEDLSILTAHPDFGKDAAHFFDAVCRAEVPADFRTLIPAPQKMHRRMIALVRREREAAEAGRSAKIIAKVNALVDEELINELYRASQAGVKVDLIVRGACSLIPGVTGLSENIRVISVVDRFLEHSRIYYFRDSNEMYLSSADWMPRNFFSRLELAYPVLDTNIRRFIEDILLPAYLGETVKAKELTPQGTWKKRGIGSRKLASKSVRSLLKETGESQIRCQFFFSALAESGYRGTILDEELWKRI